MKTEWDYTSLADAYLKRPDYSLAAVTSMLKICGGKPGTKVCDIGAGVAHLTLMLANFGAAVTAVEPNDAMRKNGIIRTSSFKTVAWKEGTGEDTGLDSHSYDIVTFGSSFNVCDRPLALKETARLLKPHGWFACMWNHRDLSNPIQSQIEAIIKTNIPEYAYGTRREDQTSVINASRLFGSVIQVKSEVTHKQTIQEIVEAWASHATLERQSSKIFNLVLSQINDYLHSLNIDAIYIPYTTNIWVAQLN